ncbi:MAG: lipopolysaccharide biosynthesis protein [Bacteroidota bacterium]|nr:lipopolysaccharide biosynthesis protein [Bacteroidota bacterium]
MDNLKKRSLNAIIWDMAGKFAGQGIGFVISIILARLLSPQDFGLLAMVNVVIALATVLVDMGLGSALIQRQDVTDEHYGSVFYFNLAVGSFLALILFATAPLIASFYGRTEIVSLARVMSLLFVINSFCNVQRLWLRKQLNYKILTQASVVGTAIGGISGVTLAFTGFGVWSLVAQTLISAICNNLYVYFQTKWKPRLIMSMKALKELWLFGFNLFLSAVLDSIFTQLDSIIIGRIFSAQTLGYYFRSKSLDAFVRNYTSGSLMAILFPVLSTIQNEEERYKEIIYKSFHVLNFITFLLLGILYLGAKDIIVMLFSDKWLPSVEYFQIIVLAGFVYPFSSLLVNILSSKGNSKAFLKLEVYKKIVLAINFGIGFLFGIKGFLYGMVIFGIIALVLNILYAAKEMKVSNIWFYQVIWKYLLIGAISTSGLAFWGNKLNILHIFHFLFIVGIYTVLYVIIAYWLRLPGVRFIGNEFVKLQIAQKIRQYTHSIWTK